MGWRRFLRRGWWDDERSRELESYLELETDDNIARGMRPDEARAAARRKLGSTDRIRDEIFAINSFTPWEWLSQDLRYALRVLRRSPGFALAATLTLALGIGGFTTIYSVVRSVVLDPFPYRDSHRLVDVFVRDIEAGHWRSGGRLGVDEFLDYAEHSEAFEDVVGTISTQPLMTATPDGALVLNVAQVTPNTLDFLGVPPALGRTFGAADASPSSPAVVVLAHYAWMKQFGGDTSIVGRAITLADRAHTIVGVMPPRVAWHNADAWVPYVPRRGTTAPDDRSLWFQARLAPGLSVHDAEARLEMVARRRAAVEPSAYPAAFRMEVVTVVDFVVGRFRQALYTLLGAVGVLLVIACCNVANMILARTTTRERELTLRVALGAGPLRLGALLMTEAWCLALGGGLLGCLLAWFGVKGLALWLPEQNVAWEVVLRVDRVALGVSALAMFVTTFLIGVLPSWQAARRSLAPGMQQSGKGATANDSGGWLRSSLVVTEVALSLVLVVSAGVLMRNFLAVVSVDPGLDTSHLLVARPQFPEGDTPPAVRQHEYAAAAGRALRSVPGVEVVARSSAGPLTGTRLSVGRSGASDVPRRDALVTLADERLLDALDLPARSGRHLSAADVEQGARVAVVNRTLVETLFGEEQPLGQFVHVTTRGAATPDVIDDVVRIVGVVDDVRNEGLRRPPAPTLYVPLGALPLPPAGTLVIRTTSPAAAVLPSVERALRSADPTVAVRAIYTVDEMLRFARAQPQFGLLIFSAFATAGLLLVAVGVAGVMGYVASRRSQEFAVRMAVGATQRDILSVVLTAGVRLLIVGVILGLVGSWYSTRVLRNTMSPYGEPDSWVGLAALGVIVVVGLAACTLPAWRAARTNPIDALRQE